MDLQCVECDVVLKPSARFCSACGTPAGESVPVAVERQSLALQRDVVSGGPVVVAAEPMVAVSEPTAGADLADSSGDRVVPATAAVVPSSSAPVPVQNHVTASSIESAPMVGSNAIVNVHMQAPGMVMAPKSVGVALLLTFFFGPLGMLYSTVGGALVMMGLSLLLGWTVVALPFLWLGAMVWGSVAVSSSNAAVAAGRAPNTWGR